MQVEVGAVVEGTVTGITKFGAFVSLPDGRSGLVHISEIANTYVNDVNEFLKLGDKVKVRVLAVTPDGKINLSIKKAEPAPERPNNRPMHGGRPGAFGDANILYYLKRIRIFLNILQFLYYLHLFNS